MRWILLKALILVLSDKQVLIALDDECDGVIDVVGSTSSAFRL